jgi:phosphotransferase system enzyme I (PtsI)
MITGIAASPGAVFGKALVLKEEPIVLNTHKISEADVDAEKAKFFAGREKAAAQLNAIREKAERDLGSEKAAIFEGHLMILEDEELEEEILGYLEENLVTADVAASQVIDMQAAMLSDIDDEYLKETREFIDTLSNVERVDVLPYHTLGIFKWEELGIPYKLEGVEPPTKERIENAKAILGAK